MTQLTKLKAKTKRAMARNPEWVYVTIGAANLPYGADKKQLLPPAQRAKVAVKYLDGITVCAISELAGSARIPFMRAKGMGLTNAMPNNIVPRLISNSQVFDQREVKLVKKRNMQIPMPGRRLGLNMTVRLYKHLDTGTYFAVIGFHAPRKALDAKTNRLVLETVLVYALGLNELSDLPVFLAGDTNNAAYLEVFRSEGVRTVSHVVDVVGALGARSYRRDVITDGWLGEVADHSLLVGMFRFPAKRRRRAPRLPSIQAALREARRD